MYQSYNKRLPFLNLDRCCQALCPQQSRNESKECKYHHSLLSSISAIYFTHLLPCAPFKSSSNVDDRTLHEIYIWPYARMIEAGIGGLMCSYNQIDGEIYHLLKS